MNNEHNPKETALLTDNHHNVTVVSPISSLPTDILLEIFKMNANTMDRDGPLDNRYPITQNRDRAINATRLVSQVSSPWRDLIINAPILWARLIDLDFLHLTGDRWRAEVILRTQDSPLYVKGHISFKTYNIYRQPWWLDFFNLSWPRIRKFDLDVRFDREVISSQYSSMVKALSFLSRPSSTLQHFRMIMEHRCQPWETGSLFFDNSAPQLRYFQTKNIQFSDKYTWFSTLHNFHIYRHDGSVFKSADVLFEVLSRMHHLETLHVDDNGCSSPIVPDRIPIHLPRLRYIGLRSTADRRLLKLDNYEPSSWWSFLNHLTPKFGCSVRLKVHLSPEGEIDTNFLSHVARNHFQIYRPTFLDIDTYTNYFVFSDVGDEPCTELIPETPTFDLDFEFFVGDFLPSTDRRIYQLFKEILLLSFPEVVELHIAICTAHATLFTDDQFGRFLSSFTGLKRLVTFPETLHRLYTSPVVNTLTLFPLLEDLEIIVEETFQHPGEIAPDISLPETLVSIFRLREEAGVPISTFNYRCATEPSLLSDQKPLVDDLTSLDIFTGLKVIWNFRNFPTRQYTCGSGSPEELDFVGKFRSARARRLRELPDT